MPSWSSTWVVSEGLGRLVCSTAGLATDGYSFPYVASWAAGDSDQVRVTAEAAIGCARRILAAAGLAEPKDEEAAA